MIECYGCGALVEGIGANPHKYIGAAAGCWQIYGEVLAKEYSNYAELEDTHRLTVDTYAVQHPGESSRQAIQSVNIHLLSLYSIFVQNFDSKRARDLIGKALKANLNLKWLEPPSPNGNITIIDVSKSQTVAEHKKIVQKWAGNVFDCWYLKHKNAIESIFILFSI